MKRNRVFIYGSCVSRDTFEHLEPSEFELIQYVARQSAVSAYTRSVDMVEPPVLRSPFQHRMVAGDYASNLRDLIPEVGPTIDLVLTDLIDERLGVYVLPDGSVITRSLELIESGAEKTLPAGTQHVPFGTSQHVQYWSAGIKTVGQLLRRFMPQAAVVLLDIPWAERSLSGEPTPDSFGVKSSEANQVFPSYIARAAEALDARVISIGPGDAVSSPHHPWGDAPFHYAEAVYIEIARQLTGRPGRLVWGEADQSQSERAPAPNKTATRVAVRERSRRDKLEPSSPSLGRLPEGGPNFLLAGVHRSATTWIQRQLEHHPDIFIASGGQASNFFNSNQRVNDSDEVEKYVGEFRNETALRRGERSVMYFWSGLGNELSPERANTALHVAQMLEPDAPIIVSLRDPVSRAISAYWAALSVGKLDFASTIFRTPPPMGILDLGFYRRHYEAWAKHVGTDRIHIALYDDICTDPHSVIADILRTLGLSGSQEFWSKTTLEKRENYKNWIAPMRKSGQVSPQEVRVLLELYRDDIEFLEELLGRRLDAWKDPLRLIAANCK